MKMNSKKIIRQIPSVLIMIYIILMISLLLLATTTQSLRELRDAANITFAQKIVNLENPYRINEGSKYIESINVYPPLNMLIASFIHFITKINLYNIFYFLDFIYVIATAFTISFFIRKEFHLPRPLILCAFAASLTLGWRTGFISSVPDHLGMLICILLLISVHYNKSIFQQAILTVLAFYSKQYFLAIAASVFLFYCLKNIKKAMQYFIFTALLGILSILVINYFFPAFSTQILFFMFAENSGLNTHKIFYSIKQMAQAFASYGIYSIFLFTKYSSGLRNFFIHKKFSKTNLTVFDINNVLMFIILLYLGTNKGAFLSYHLTLLIPGIIIIGSVEINKFYQKLNSGKQISFLYALTVISIALLLKIYELPHIQTETENKEWTAVETLVSQYEGNQYLLPHMGYFAYKNKLPLSDNGHADYIVSLADSKIITTNIDVEKVSKYFPYISTLYEYAVTQKQDVLNNVKQQNYSLIIRYHSDTSLYGYDITNYYKCIDTLSFSVGKQPCTIDFYIPK